MGKTNTIIEINGKRYDANTGHLLVDGVMKPTVKPATAAKHRPAVAAQTHPASKPAAAAPATKRPTMQDVVKRKPAKHAGGRQPAPAKTLMRHSVKKPSASLKRHVKAVGSTDSSLAAAPLAQIAATASIGQIDERRISHAKRVPKSRLIQHFSPVAKAGPPPAAALGTIPTPAPIRPAAPKHRSHPQRPAAANTTADLLERAIQSADSHKQPAYKPRGHRKTRRKLALATTAALSVAVIGFVASQNLQGLQLHMASAKAGFNAALPGYRPPGYSIGQLDYGDGQVATQFLSNSNDGSYTLIQKRSSWDSQALLESVVKPADPDYQTVQTAGRTVFLYGRHDAAWVNGGVWYQIQSNGSLSDRQLTEIAASL